MPLIDITEDLNAEINRVEHVLIFGLPFEKESELIKQNRTLYIGEIVYVLIGDNIFNVKISYYGRNKFNDLPYINKDNMKILKE